MVVFDTGCNGLNLKVGEVFKEYDLATGFCRAEVREPERIGAELGIGIIDGGE